MSCFGYLILHFPDFLTSFLQAARLYEWVVLWGLLTYPGQLLLFFGLFRCILFLCRWSYVCLFNDFNGVFLQYYITSFYQLILFTICWFFCLESSTRFIVLFHKNSILLLLCAEYPIFVYFHITHSSVYALCFHHLSLFYFFQHIMEEEHEHISKRILWRPKMVSPMELDELRAIFL